MPDLSRRRVSPEVHPRVLSLQRCSRDRSKSPMRRLSLSVLALALALNAPRPAAAADLIGFWDAPRHGGNSFNRLPPDAAYFAALRGYG
ncbi:hypothetical protein RNS14_12360, partial [Staphylococcus pseudintermedius]